MTGAGAPGAAGIIKCLQQDGNIHLTVADVSENAVGRYLVDDFVQIPKGDDPAFINAVLKICREKQIHVILPLVTKELFPLSQHKRTFKEADVKVLVSSKEAIDLSNNKSACYRFLQEKRIAVPTHFVVNNSEEFIHAAIELGHPQKAFCFKPSISNGSRGFRIVSDSIDESEMLFNHKPYNTWITYQHALKILQSKPFPQLLVSEYLPGDEYSVDCLAKNGKAVLVVPRIRKKMINGISVEGEFIQNEEVINYCIQIIEAIGLQGNIGVQVKYSEGGKPLLLEINPRVQGTIVAALGAGVNLPLLAVKQELNLPINDYEMEVEWGTKFMRHWTEVFYT
jgi:carbamoyl-phosphate synthase large subunit